MASILSELVQGLDYGIDRACRVMMQDPKFNKKRPESVDHPVPFATGEYAGKLSAGLLTLVMIDIPSLGYYPFHNRLKYGPQR